MVIIIAVFMVIIIAALLFIYADRLYDIQLDLKHDHRRLLSGDDSERPMALWISRNDAKVWARIFSVLMILFVLCGLYLFMISQQPG